MWIRNNSEIQNERDVFLHIRYNIMLFKSTLIQIRANILRLCCLHEHRNVHILQHYVLNTEHEENPSIKNWKTQTATEVVCLDFWLTF